MISRHILGVLVFGVALVHSQTLTGKIVDAKTNRPIESVAVFFNNTTVGTSTNQKGEFSINYTDAVQSTLVISFLGYEKLYISDYRLKKHIRLKLKESASTLDEVVISYDDGLTHKQKIKLFRENFLGTSKFGKSCEVLNEDVVYLRYNKKNKTLSANTSQPLIIINKSLAYQITYDLADFEIQFSYADLKNNHFHINQVAYYGTTLFRDLNSENPKRKIIKHREKAYEFSVQRFIRALYHKDFKAKGYLFGERGFKISPYKYLKLSNVDDNGFVTANLSRKIAVYYNDDISGIHPLENSEFKIDQYGNYSPVQSILFSGDLGSKRVGDTLPLDYDL